ncbi:MAG: DUF3368 domain-containing protein [Burkholderiaceae bacterium]
MFGKAWIPEEAWRKVLPGHGFAGERAGWAVAAEHGLRVASTAAVIGMAKSRGLMPSAREVFAKLHASDFRISAAVIETVLRRVGE